MVAKKISRPVGYLTQITAIIVVLVIVWQMYQDARRHPLAPKQVLIDELRAMPVPSGVQSLGNLKLTDRDTFYYVDERYSSTVSLKTVADSYVEKLPAEGWRLDWRSSDDYQSLWFCKNGVLASIDFFGGSNSPTYTLSLTTGGWVIRECG